jgi:purine-binding chemotaxis protein CheW
MANSEIGATAKASRVRNVAFRGYRDGTAEFLGDQIEAMTGYSRQQFNSKSMRWIDIVLEEDRPHLKEVFIKALHGDKTYMREYRIRTKTGQILWLREWSQIICDDNDAVEYVAGIIMDNTEQKQEETLRLKYERRTGKYLTFSLAGQEYGISILKVKEIIEVMPVTPVPHAPPYVKGVINLRGRVIPVVDLRIRFAMKEAERSDRSCIIVLEVTNRANGLLTGIIVDSVSEVLHIKGIDIEDNPRYLSRFNTDYILGMAKVDRGLRVILDVDRVLEGMELGATEDVA